MIQEPKSPFQRPNINPIVIFWQILKRAEQKRSSVKWETQARVPSWCGAKTWRSFFKLFIYLYQSSETFHIPTFLWLLHDLALMQKKKSVIWGLFLWLKETWAPLWVWHQQNDGCMFSTLQLLQQKVHILNESKHFCRYTSALTILTWWQWTHQQFEISETDDKLMCTLQKKRA